MKFKASAPGRLDVMGGISDYSGALVLQMPLAQKTEVEIEENETELLTISSYHEGHFLGSFEINWNYLKTFISSPERFREIVTSQKNGNWAIYPAACLAILIREKEVNLNGIAINISSTVPLGKGVSSSAAIEVATIRALAGLKNLAFKGTELAVLAQKAENQYVGAPCGLMDQLASTFGENGKLLPIICQPDLLKPTISIPDQISFFGIDSGVKHEVTGASYGDVRTAAAIGYSIIAQHLGVSEDQLKLAKLSGDKSNLPYQGYLTNISFSEFCNEFQSLLPKKVGGGEFLKKYKETADPFAKIETGTEYPVSDSTIHPIAENERTRQFESLIVSLSDIKEVDKKEAIYRKLGELMFASHESYSACGLGHPKTDMLVEMVRSNLGNGVFGAKITGGGSGGTVCVLAVGETGRQKVREIHETYQNLIGKKVLLICP